MKNLLNASVAVFAVLAIAACSDAGTNVDTESTNSTETAPLESLDDSVIPAPTEEAPADDAAAEEAPADDAAEEEAPAAE